MDNLGKIAYEAYCQSSGGRSLVSGDDLPPYDGLPAPIQAAWTMAATAVYHHCNPSWDRRPGGD